MGSLSGRFEGSAGGRDEYTLVWGGETRVTTFSLLDPIYTWDMRIVLAIAILWICQCPILAQPLPPEPDMSNAAYAQWVEERAELWNQEVVGLEVAGDPEAQKLAKRVTTIRRRLLNDATRGELHPMVVHLEWDLEASFNALNEEQKKAFFASRF